MGIPLGGGNFTRGAAIPLDDSFVAADATARDAINAGIRYEGMLVYVVADQTMYQLQGGITNGDWAAAGGGGGGGSVPVVDLATGDGVLTAFTLSQDPGTEENVAVYLDGVRQSTAEYSIVTTTLTFSVAPYNGATLMFVIGGVTVVNVPANGSVTTAKIADDAVTYAKLAARSGFNNPAGIGEIAMSASSGSFFHQNTTEADVTNLSVTLTTKGGPVEVYLIDDGSTSSSGITVECSSAGFPNGFVKLYRDTTNLTRIQLGSTAGTYPVSSFVPASSIKHLDFPAAGTYVYKVAVNTGSTGTTSITVRRCKLIAREL